MRLDVTLTAESPLAISRWRATGSELETLRHVPGTVWRGALAAALIRDKGLGDQAHEDEVFRDIFLSGKVRFGDLRPEGSWPWPLSARICARTDEHGTQDLLIRSALNEDLPLECEFKVAAGRTCGAKLTGPQGFYHWEGPAPLKEEVRVRVAAHTAIENMSLRPRSGQFFSSEVIERFTRFKGEAWLEDEGLEKEISTPRTLTVGRGATRGQGLATLEVRPPIEPGDDLAERLERLNRRFEPKGLVAFSCTLRSPCLVFDEWLCSRSYLTAADVAEAVGAPAQDLDGYELYSWYSRGITIGGWNARASLPRGDFEAIAAGSAFLFAREIAANGREDELKRLSSLLADCPKGIGERWEEGFGEAVFCDPFHYTLRRS